MEIVKVKSHKELLDKLTGLEEAFVLIYKEGSELSNCAFANLKKVYENGNNVFAVDVNEVKDVHVQYGIATAPSLMVFDSGKFKNVIKGCMSEAYYSDVLKGHYHASSSDKDKKKTKRVIVYTTPTCSWCVKIKDHLKANNISYREVNVAADPSMAEEMKRKSGQMGVPQTEIDGQMIVGFDRPKIDKLLEIA